MDVAGATGVAGPLLWIAANWAVQAVLFAAAGRWDVHGQVFLSAAYYQRTLLA